MHRSLGLRNITVACVPREGERYHRVGLDRGQHARIHEGVWLTLRRLRYSRARDALYVIGNKAELEGNNQRDSDMRVFEKLLGMDDLGRVRWQLRDGPQESPYVSEQMVDVSMEADFDNSATGGGDRSWDADAMDVGGNTAGGGNGDWGVGAVAGGGVAGGGSSGW